jgi:hypothetical protein
MAGDVLWGEAWERSMRGVFEPNVFQGRFVYPQEEVEITPAVRDRRGRVLQPARREWRDVPGSAPLGVWRKSERLLIFILSRLLPERYGPAKGVIEATAPDDLAERLRSARKRMRSKASEAADAA